MMTVEESFFIETLTPVERQHYFALTQMERELYWNTKALYDNAREKGEAEHYGDTPGDDE